MSQPVVVLSPKLAKEALRGLSIPPRPTILVDIYTRLQHDEPDSKEIAARIARDVVLSAAVLKTVNASAFGLRAKSTSVSHAVQMLGVKNLSMIVTGLVLKNSLGGSKPSLERFWDSAEKVANISAHIAGSLPLIPREEAYVFGLFRDVGIPLLMQKWPERGGPSRGSSRPGG